MKKRDKETGQDVPQRDAKLEGAEFTVKYYKGDYAEDVDPATQGATPERTWVLKQMKMVLLIYKITIKFRVMNFTIIAQICQQFRLEQ